MRYIDLYRKTTLVDKSTGRLINLEGLQWLTRDLADVSLIYI